PPRWHVGRQQQIRGSDPCGGPGCGPALDRGAGRFDGARTETEERSGNAGHENDRSARRRQRSRLTLAHHPLVSRLVHGSPESQILPPAGRDMSFSTQNVAVQGRKPAPCDHFRTVLREYNSIVESRLMLRIIFLSALKRA